jgi:hypothetical protein
MTAWISGLNENIYGAHKARHAWPPWDSVEILATLNEMLEGEISDITFKFTNEGLIVDVFNLDNENVATRSMTYEELIADMLPGPTGDLI